MVPVPREACAEERKIRGTVILFSLPRCLCIAGYRGGCWFWQIVEPAKDGHGGISLKMNFEILIGMCAEARTGG